MVQVEEIPNSKGILLYSCCERESHKSKTVTFARGRSRHQTLRKFDNVLVPHIVQYEVCDTRAIWNMVQDQPYLRLSEVAESDASDREISAT